LQILADSLTFISPTLALDCEWKVENDGKRTGEVNQVVSIYMDVSAEYIPNNHFKLNVNLIDYNKF